ncbi:MAG TPA: TonB-dependent receptor [Verrucomicrobiae bacterium]|nr:TonB-dependent receptor [Verrucomicrobiae bacterium]
MLSLATLLLVTAVFSTAAATNEVTTPAELKRLSLEDLENQDVTVVSRRPEKLSESPSAVQVITGEDIHRSGATSLPEALRLAPNLEVAQVNSHDWAISARGFNNTLANKLLVMIDGRTVYTPLDAGVFWDVQNVLLEDVDRIEVVSGPGGTLWGANAVNGVINIVTKSARDTQGLLLEGGGGSLLQDSGAVRYGGGNGTNLFYRVYAQRFDRNDTVFPNGNDATDSWDMSQGGFRMDWYPSDANTLTVQGDAYSGSEAGLAGDTFVDGQNVLSRWSHTISENSDLTVQAYFDRTWREVPDSFAEDLKTSDLDVQHRFALGERQSVTWGGGYRLMEDRVQNTPALAFIPADRNMQLFSAFVQDQITFVPDRLQLTVGSKLEHNDFSGFEFQPSARLAWTPDDRQTFWGAVSRAVRSPSRIDSDFRVPGTGPSQLIGDSDFDSETVLTYEAGYRVRPIDRLSLSVASYYNDYAHLRSLDQISPTNFVIGNGFHGQTWGIDLSGTWQATAWWRLRGGYTYLNKLLWANRPGVLSSVREGNDPENQVMLQSIMDLPAHFQLDVVGRYVDTLQNPHVPNYVSFDARLAWWCKGNLEISLVGQNLCDNQHAEFGAAATRQEIPRSVFGKAAWWF